MMRHDTIARHGRIDVSSTTRITGGSRAWKFAPERLRRVLDVNLTGAYLTIRAIVPRMIESGDGAS